MNRNPDCIFCKIISGEIPSQIIWETDTHMAFLDIFPLRKAQTVVIPKEHLHSSIFSHDDETFHALMQAVKDVAVLLETKLGAERTMIVGEGLEIDHVHLKLYPRFRNEHGLVHGGPPADADGLRELAQLIKG